MARKRKGIKDIPARLDFPNPYITHYKRVKRILERDPEPSLEEVLDFCVENGYLKPRKGLPFGTKILE